MTKEMVGWVDKAFPRSFISLDRESIRNLAQLITGHCTLEGHRWRTDASVEDPICPECGVEVETPQHFVENCEKFETIRKEIFGHGTLRLSQQLENLNFRRIARFVQRSGRLIFTGREGNRLQTRAMQGA